MKIESTQICVSIKIMFNSYYCMYVCMYLILFKLGLFTKIWRSGEKYASQPKRGKHVCLWPKKKTLFFLWHWYYIYQVNSLVNVYLQCYNQ